MAYWYPVARGRGGCGRGRGGGARGAAGAGARGAAPGGLGLLVEPLGRPLFLGCHSDDLFSRFNGCSDYALDG